MNTATLDTPETATLTKSDRCDRCPAQAAVRVQLNSGGDLDFCGHHYADNEAALQGRSRVLADTRAQ